MSTKRKPPLPRKRCMICHGWFRPRSRLRVTCSKPCSDERAHRHRHSAAFRAAAKARYHERRRLGLPVQHHTKHQRHPADLPTWGPGDWLGVDRLGRVVAL